VSERIRSTIEKQEAIGVTVSLGMTVLTADLRASQLAADTALYRAKGRRKRAAELGRLGGVA
jgi:GGDEF domain-containing protein